MLKQFVKKAKEAAVDHPHTKNAVVALDIGTENVKALITRGHGDDVEIFGAGRSKQKLTDMHAGAIADIQAVIENCDRALAEAEGQAEIRGKRVVVGIAGELIKGITDSVTISREDGEALLTTEEIDDIIKQAQAKSYAQAKAEVSLELGHKDVELRLVNSALVSINIDGYKVTNPVGFQGKEVEVQLYTAFAPLVHIGAVERVVHELDLELIAVAAEPFAVARSIIGDDADASTNAIIIDVGGGTTDIGVLRDGGLEGTRMFGIGGRSFTKAIARALNIHYDKAEDIKLNIDKLEAKPDVIEALQKTAQVWIDGVHLALAEFDWLDYLPNQILLCGGGASLQIVQDILQSEDWHVDLPFSRSPKPVFIKVDDVEGMKDLTGKINDHTMITAMGLARVGSDTLSGDAPEAGFKKKLTRLLEN